MSSAAESIEDNQAVNAPVRDPASFRDPAGTIFMQGRRVLRKIHQAGRESYELLIASGLYKELSDEGMLLSHSERDDLTGAYAPAYKIIEPRKIPFISYAHEWCFEQLRDAARLTLAIQSRALAKGLSLKDASSYNIQFLNGRPVLIDTLSFERYQEGQPWVAYRQFCQHFLAPLALMSYGDRRCAKLMQLFIDGIPLEFAANILPFRARLNPRLLLHLFLHARFQQRYSNTRGPSRRQSKSTSKVMSRAALNGLVASLTQALNVLKEQGAKTEWGQYYQDTNYSSGGLAHKSEIVERFVESSAPQMVWDFGANSGRFSRAAAKYAKNVVAFDLDEAAVAENYRFVRSMKEERIQPLVLDLSNPTPSFGWANEERGSILRRGPADLVLALALVHHLAIGNNLPFYKVAEFFARCAPRLIIEFVPKEDSQVQRLLLAREDIFAHYDERHFIEEFSEFFDVEAREKVRESARTIFLFKRKGTCSTSQLR